MVVSSGVGTGGCGRVSRENKSVGGETELGRVGREMGKVINQVNGKEGLERMADPQPHSEGGSV